MDQSKMAIKIVITCMVLVGAFSAFALYKSLRPTVGLPYERISMEQAEEYMSYEDDFILLDVRTQEEFDTGHIPGAVCIPVEEIGQRAEKELTDKDQMIYVYCRSGNRSQKAAAKLCEMGYTNVTEIGGITDWKGILEK